ncbi:hypothetical protein THIX_60611 [Thiomonas sp. X19]|nr:hypothetical protein THIX_60611 [Thiomonas sp. X19]
MPGLAVSQLSSACAISAWMPPSCATARSRKRCASAGGSRQVTGSNLIAAGPAGRSRLAAAAPCAKRSGMPAVFILPSSFLARFLTKSVFFMLMGHLFQVKSDIVSHRLMGMLGTTVAQGGAPRMTPCPICCCTSIPNSLLPSRCPLKTR